MREVQARFETPDGQPLRGRVRLRLIASADDAGAGYAAGDEVIVTGVAEPILDENGWLRAADGGPLMLRPTDGATNPSADPDAISSPERTVWELTVDPDGQPDHLRLVFDLPSGSTPVQVWDVLTEPPSGLVAPHSHPAPDHGALTGLGDDDHPQYVPVDGTRAADMLDVTGDITVGGRVFAGPELAATSSDPLPGDVRLVAAGRVLRVRERPADIDPDAKEANLGLWTVGDVDGEFVVIDRSARFGGLRRRLFVRDLTASRDLAVTDLGALIAGAGVTITVPDDATLRGQLPADWLVPGLFVDLLQTGPAPLVVEAGTGVTLVGSGAGRISLGWEGASARLIRLDTDRWVVMGQTAAAAAGLQQIVPGRWTTVPWGTGATGSINPTLNELVAIPLPTRGGTVDAVAVQRMGTTQTGCRIRIGVYDSRGGMPGRLIAELGSWLVEAVADHTLTLASPVTLPPGRLWLATVVQGAAGAFRGWTAAASYSGAPAGSPSFQVDGLAHFFPVPGALPSSLEGATWAERNTSIVVHLRGG